MQLHRHHGEGDDNALEQEEIKLWEEIAAQEDIGETPRHGRNQKQDEEFMPRLPGTTANRSDKQRYVSN